MSNNQLTLSTNNDIEIGNLVLFPESANEIVGWAQKYGITNSYDSHSNERIKGLHCIGEFQKKLLGTLIEGRPLSDEQKEFIKKTEEVVKLITVSTIGEGVKKTIIDTIITDNNPRMHDGVVSNMIKKINCEEIIPGELVQITHIDYQDSEGSIGGVQGYWRGNNPTNVYNHCLSIKQFNDIEKKIIELYIDKKPYRKNYILLTRKETAIKDITFNREKGIVEFICGDELYDSFRVYHFLLTIFNDLSREEYGEQVYDLSVEEKKEKVLNSEWFKKFKPDFLDKK